MEIEPSHDIFVQAAHARRARRRTARFASEPRYQQASDCEASQETLTEDDSGGSLKQSTHNSTNCTMVERSSQPPTGPALPQLMVG